MMKSNVWKSVKNIWVISYTFVFLLPILIGVFNYIYYYNVMKNDIISNSEMRLQDIQYNINNEISHLYDGKNVISRIKNLGMIAMADSEEVTEYELLEARLNLAQNSSNSYEYGIYYKNLDCVVTGSAVYDTKYYYRIYFSAQMGWEEFLDFLGSASSSIRCVKNSEGDVFFTQHVSNVVDTFFVLKSSYLKEVMQMDNALPGSVLVMLDGEKNILYSNTQVSDAEIKQVLGEKEQMEQNVSFQGKSYTTLRFTSNGLQYVFFIPNQFFRARMQRIQYGYLLTVLLCLLCGGISIFVMIRMNYRPVNKLIEYVNVREKGENEYKAIADFLDRTIGQNKKLENRLRKSRDIVQSEMINRILLGKFVDSGDQKELLEKLGFCGDDNHFVVLTFSVSDYGVLEEDEEHIDEAEIHHIACLVMNNIIGELIDRQYRCVMSELDENLVCIVNLGVLVEENVCEHMKHIVMEAQEHIRFHFKFSFLTGIGTVVKGTECLPDSYLDSLAALQMGDEKYGEISLCFQRNVSETYKYYRFYEKEKMLTEVIRAGDYEHASKYMKEMIEECTKNSRQVMGISKCLLYDIINVIIKNCMLDSQFAEEADIVNLERMFLSDNPVELLRELDTLLRKTCELGQMQSDNDSNLSQEIQSYIDENFSDFNLNVNKVAEHFQYTPFYISKIFKEMCGKSILQYIMEVRMKNAQELLRRSDIPVMDVAGKVGITNKSTFMRVFKKATGMTPGQFRKLGK